MHPFVPDAADCIDPGIGVAPGDGHSPAPTGLGSPRLRSGLVGAAVPGNHESAGKRHHCGARRTGNQHLQPGPGSKARAWPPCTDGYLREAAHEKQTKTRCA